MNHLAGLHILKLKTVILNKESDNQSPELDHCQEKLCQEYVLLLCNIIKHVQYS